MPKMISQITLVCLPAATNAWAGLVMASMKAHASTMNAAMASATKKYASGAYAPLPSIPTTSPRYLAPEPLGPVVGRLGGAGRLSRVSRLGRFRLAQHRYHLGGRRRRLALPAEGLVDLDQDLLLPFGDLLQDVRAGLAQPALDLAEVRVRDPGRLGQLAQRELRLLPLLPDVVPDGVHGF